MGVQELPVVSILFPKPKSLATTAEQEREPEFFRDLNLDQLVKAMVERKEGYDIRHFFYSPVPDVATARYRQDVARDLEETELADSVGRFASQMSSTRGFLRSIPKLTSRHYRQGWFLDAAERYSSAVNGLAEDLEHLGFRSEGLRALRDYLRKYVVSSQFAELCTGVAKLRAEFAEVRYTTYIRGGRVTVNRYDNEADYSAEIEAVFAKFRQGMVKDYRAKFRDARDANHVHAQILEQLAKLYPDLFGELESYCSRCANFVDVTLATFDNEVQFYLSYLELAGRLKATGLPFCYPEMPEGEPDLLVESSFDMALAALLPDKRSPVVCNDVELKRPQRIVVVSGPNQGGKTTFARMFGQLHYLAGLGLPVPGRSVKLGLPDRVFTHFERQERFDDLYGKLEDELVRVHDILLKATANSVVVMNESFSSTSLTDNRFIGTKVLEKLTELGPRCLYVTFVDELTRLNEAVVSYVSEVSNDDPGKRTFKVLRRPADGRAYALTIAERYGLTYDVLKQRVAGS